MATEAVLETLRQLWLVLDENKVQAAVVGGLALAVWKHPRSTLDVDVLLIADGKQYDELIDCLRRARFERKRDEVIHLGETDLVQFHYEPVGAYIDVQVDLLRARSAYAREAVGRCITLGENALGFPVQVLGCEDLILLKLLAGRIIDRADAAALLRANIGAIKEDLLNSLAARLGLTSALVEIRREAIE